MTTNSDVLTTFLGYDERDLEFERIASDLDSYDIDYGVEIIFDYYRRNGFPHYTVREDEKHQHMRKIQRFDVDTIFQAILNPNNARIKNGLDILSTFLGSSMWNCYENTYGNIFGR